VDIGAWHPVFDSVSRHFILNGWSGQLIEPNPHYYLLNAEEYSDNERIRVINAAVTDKDSHAVLFVRV
jgi:FkbM family methyltransferase